MIYMIICNRLGCLSLCCWVHCIRFGHHIVFIVSQKNGEEQACTGPLEGCNELKMTLIEVFEIVGLL